MQSIILEDSVKINNIGGKMKEIILLKNGELALKGLNRATFEDVLIKNVRRRLSGLGEFSFQKAQSTIVVEPSEDVCLDEAVDRLKKVFGIAALSRAAACEKNLASILENTINYLGERLSESKTFKVEAKRSDKKFPLKSPEICNEVGGHILSIFPHLSVDVHEPELTVTVEIRDKYAFIRGNQIKGAGGMPVGTGGKAALMISGGIDSPVAGYMLAKRGIQLTAIHFASPPYTSPQAEAKVHSLLKQVAAYSGRINLITVPFTKIQEKIRMHCPEELSTVIMRRFMMKIASDIAIKEDCLALITGESVGQVASQTIYALQCTDDAATLPVFRPLIGMDKDEIISISRKIETFDISIMPFEDCCTVFTPKHPKTRPSVESTRKAQEKLDVGSLCEEAANNTVLKIID